MDASASKTVATCTLLTSATSACLAGLYGSFSGKHPGILAASAALNGGISAGAFFSVREYLVGPILVTTLPLKQYTRRRLENTPTSSYQPEGEQWTSLDMRTHKLLDSGLSGGITGGILNTLKRGRSGMAPGVSTGMLVCIALQYAFNELDLARVRYVFGGQAVASPPQRSSNFVPPIDEQPAKSFMERTFALIGFNKVSDEEYLTKLKRTRDRHVKRIEQLEQQIDKKNGGAVS